MKKIEQLNARVDRIDSVLNSHANTYAITGVAGALSALSNQTATFFEKTILATSVLSTFLFISFYLRSIATKLKK